MNWQRRLASCDVIKQGKKKKKERKYGTLRPGMEGIKSGQQCQMLFIDKME